MKINLREIPEEGSHYILNRKTAELNITLKDLIGNSDFEADLFIKPMNTKNYDVVGSIKTTKPEMCSLCGDQFDFKVSAQFHEILIPGAEEIKNAQFAKSNHVSELRDDGPGVTEYMGDHFDLGEYLHEAIAISIPFNPKHEIGDKNCSLAIKSADAEVFIYDEKMDKEIKKSAFDALKGIKLN